MVLEQNVHEWQRLMNGAYDEGDAHNHTANKEKET